MHALSGGDTTSAVYKLGKRTAYSVLSKNAEALQSTETENIPGRHYDLRYSTAIRPPHAR